MKGSCLHECFAEREGTERRSSGVWLLNNMDDAYYQIFETPDELERFIEQLRVVGDEMWPLTRTRE